MAVTIETGVFVISMIFAFGSMIFSSMTNLALKPILRVFAVVLFFAVGLYLVSGAEVTSTTQTTNGTGFITETQFLIQSDGDGMWLGYVLVGFAFINFFLMYLDFFRNNKEDE